MRKHVTFAVTINMPDTYIPELVAASLARVIAANDVTLRVHSIAVEGAPESGVNAFRLDCPTTG